MLGLLRSIAGLGAIWVACLWLLGCEGQNPISGEVGTPRSGKLAPEQVQGIPRSEVVFLSPVPGTTFEFSGDKLLSLTRVPDGGNIPPFYLWGEDIGGNYTARAFVDGEEIASWVIGIESGYKTEVKLEIGKDAVVEKKGQLSPLPPIPDVDEGSSGSGGGQATEPMGDKGG